MIRGIFNKTIRKISQTSKRVFIAFILLIFALLHMNSLSSLAAEIKFTDIDGHWGRADIVKALDEGYINGYPGNLFKPNDMVSKAEFIKMLDVVFSVPIEGTGSKYDDVSEDKWYAKYIWAAVKAGYMGIYPDDTLKPELPISRQDAAALIADLTGINGGNEVKTFKDSENIAEYAKKQVNALVSAGIMNGDTSGCFRPDDGISRAEAVAVINRALVYTKSNHINSTLEVNGSVVNIRSGPDIKYTVLTKVYKGESLKASLKYSDSWYRVEVGDKTGWISAEYVEEADNDASSSDTDKNDKADDMGQTNANEIDAIDMNSSNQSETGSTEEISYKPVNETLVVSGSVVNIRSGPGTSYDITSKVYSGNILTALLLSSNNWYIVKIGSVTGWISGDYVKLVTADNTDSSGNIVVGINTDTVSETERGNVMTDRGGDIDRRTIGDDEGSSTQPEISSPSDPENVNYDKLIVVDAGHGGYDSGAVGFYGTLEKDINLSIALKLSELLKNAGYKVLLTRSDDTFVPLEERSEIANNAGADMFICIHCNAADNKDGYGIETYTQLEFYKPVFKDQEKCIYLAALVQNELVKSLGLYNRGVKKDNLSVCRETNAPSVLIETAFIDNPDEEMLLNDQDFQSKAAEAIKLAIDKYFAD
jgi:N-acetylmuramoyl-L-alanine amidase